MAVCVPNILILGHSFVRRLRDDLPKCFDPRAAPNFHLPESGHVSLFGTGGRTVEKLSKYDLSSLYKYRPDIVVRVVGVCQVINRNTPQKSPDCHFNAKAAVLRQYLSVVLANQPGIFLWEHKEFYRSDRSFLCSDGVHCNAKGQYHLYRSYRGAILKALSLL